MLQPYTLGFNTTVIDGGNISTSTIRAQSLYSGSVDAWKVQTVHLSANCITTELLAVGPQFQFRTTAGGQGMKMNQDGSLSLPDSGLNPNDGRWVADATRSYSGTQIVKTFAATFSGGSSRGIFFNLVDPYATSGSGQRGILVWLDGGVGVYACTGVGGYPHLGSYDPGFNTLTYPTRLVIQHFGNQANPRMRVFVNGTEVNPGGFTDAFLGGSCNGQQGGCAGFLLSDQNIKVSEIVMGNQTVIIEDGRVQAQHIDAVSMGASQLIISSIVGGINNGSTTINGGKITTNTIVADHINVASLNASNAWIDSLDARIIKARTIKAGQIEAKALNFINNFSINGNTTDWSGAGPLEFITRGGFGNVRAMNIATSANVQVSSTVFPIDPTKSYQIKLGALLGTENSAGGNLYFGLYVYDKDGAELAIYPLNTSGWAAGSTNPYWFIATNPTDGRTLDLSGYIMAADCRPEDAPAPIVSGQPNPYVLVNGVASTFGTSFPVFRFPPNAVSMRVRFLNYYNGGTTRTIWFSNPSVTEYGTGVISADSIKTGSLVSSGDGSNGAYTTASVANDGTASIAYTSPGGFRISSVPFAVRLRPALNKDLNATYRTSRLVNVMAEFGGNISLGGYMIGEITSRTLNALDAPPMDAPGSTTGPWYTGAARIFYRGNIDPSTKGGAPDINCLSIKDFGSVGDAEAYNWMRFGWKLQPASPSSNLDAMRYMKVQIYSTKGAALYDTMYVPLQDRLYAHATDSDPSNAVYGDFMWGRRVPNPNTGASPYPFTGCLKITLYNAYGPSDEKWFHGVSAVDTWYTDFSTPSGGTPPSGGGGTGGGGGGGGGCLPAGSTLLVYGDGMSTLVPIETVQVGDYAIGYDDKTLRPVVSKITRTFRYKDRDLYQVVTAAGTLTCSHDHRLALVSEDGSVTYPAARELSAGDNIYWFNKQNYKLEPVRVLSSTPTGTRADVFHLTMEQGHVYIGSDFPAHNLTKIPNLDRYN